MKPLQEHLRFEIKLQFELLILCTINVTYVIITETIFNLPRLASYVCIYSEVINCETSAVLPTPESPSITTRYLKIKSSVLVAAAVSSGEPCNLLWNILQRA